MSAKTKSPTKSPTKSSTKSPTKQPAKFDEDPPIDGPSLFSSPKRPLLTGRRNSGCEFGVTKTARKAIKRRMKKMLRGPIENLHHSDTEHDHNNNSFFSDPTRDTADSHSNDSSDASSLRIDHFPTATNLNLDGISGDSGTSYFVSQLNLPTTHKKSNFFVPHKEDQNKDEEEDEEVDELGDVNKNDKVLEIPFHRNDKKSMTSLEEGPHLDDQHKKYHNKLVNTEDTEKIIKINKVIHIKRNMVKAYDLMISKGKLFCNLEGYEKSTTFFLNNFLRT
jgi:hypothetical protein